MNYPDNSTTYDLLWATCRYSQFLDDGTVYAAFEKRVFAICKAHHWDVRRLTQDYGCLVKLQISVPSKVSAYQVAQTIKNGTARIVRAHSSAAKKLPSVWTRDYYAETVGAGFNYPAVIVTDPDKSMENAIEQIGASRMIKENRHV